LNLLGYVPTKLTIEKLGSLIDLFELHEAQLAKAVPFFVRPLNQAGVIACSYKENRSLKRIVQRTIKIIDLCGFDWRNNLEWFLVKDSSLIYRKGGARTLKLVVYFYF